MKSICYCCALLLLLVFLFPDKSDLRGHWHVHPLDGAKLGDINYTIMEIFKDKTAIFGASPYTGVFDGDIDTWDKTIEFGGECGILDFDYHFKGNYLLLIQQQYGGQFKAIRCDTDCCDQQKDFFSYQKNVTIDLPIAKDTTHLMSNNFPSALENRLLYGMPKQRYQMACFAPWHTLVLDDKVASEQDILIWHEIIKTKISKNVHPQLKKVFYVDKTIKVGGIYKGLEKCREIGSRRVYFALRSESTNADFKIWLKPFDLSNLEKMDKSNNSRTVEAWLNSITPN